MRKIIFLSDNMEYRINMNGEEKMAHIIQKLTGAVILIALYFFFLGTFAAHAQEPVKKVAVLPVFLNSSGEIDTDQGIKKGSNFIDPINKILDQSGYYPVNLFDGRMATGAIQDLMNESHNYTQDVAAKLTKAHGLDGLIYVNIENTLTQTDEGIYNSFVSTYVEGFDTTGRYLGFSDEKELIIKNENRDIAGQTAETEMAVRIGKYLVRELNERNSGLFHHTMAKPVVSVSLYRLNSYEMAELFGKIIESTRGVMDARVVRLDLFKDKPKKSYIEWQIEIGRSISDPYELKRAILDKIQEVLNAENGSLINLSPQKNGSNAEIRTLERIQSARTHGDTVVFIIQPLGTDLKKPLPDRDNMDKGFDDTDRGSSFD